MYTQVKDFVNDKPLWIVTVLKAVIVVAVAFGAQVSSEQVAAIVLLAEAITMPWVRAKVTPMARIEYTD